MEGSSNEEGEKLERVDPMRFFLWLIVAHFFSRHYYSSVSEIVDEESSESSVLEVGSGESAGVTSAEEEASFLAFFLEALGDPPVMRIVEELSLEDVVP